MTASDLAIQQARNKMRRCWAGVIVAQKKADQMLQGLSPDVRKAAEYLQAAEVIGKEADRLQEWIYYKTRGSSIH